MEIIYLETHTHTHAHYCDIYKPQKSDQRSQPVLHHVSQCYTELVRSLPVFVDL